jgi:glycerol-3-phosphate cytidylyltransferase
MLSEAKSLCDYLIVGLQVDPTIDRSTKKSPVQSITERYIQLSAVKYVDEIIPYSSEEDLKNILLSYAIDVRVIGEEYKDIHFTGRDIPGHLEICHFNRRRHNFSTTELRNRTAVKHLEKN